jgi:hypothetical protein
MDAVITKLKSLIGQLSVGGSIVSGRRPARPVWLALVLVTALINSVVVAGGFLLYSKVSSGDMFTAAGTSEVTIETLDESRLNRTLDRLSQQRQRFLEVRSRPPTIPTPGVTQ